jgi:hypothetical protein
VVSLDKVSILFTNLSPSVLLKRLRGGVEEISLFFNNNAGGSAYISSQKLRCLTQTSFRIDGGHVGAFLRSCAFSACLYCCVVYLITIKEIRFISSFTAGEAFNTRLRLT